MAPKSRSQRITPPPKRRAKNRASRIAAGKARKRAAVTAAPGMVEAALAAFAHEVRTPLTGILAISSLLATSDLDERARLLESDAPYALRLDMAAACARAGNLDWREHGEGPDGEVGTVAARPEAWGDVILARKETPTSYHLSVVTDDALQGVSEVVRGQDLFWSTSVHRLLQQPLGLPQPAYRHHRLILDGSERKLSKSTDATGLRELRAGGATPADIRRLVGLP